MYTSSYIRKTLLILICFKYRTAYYQLKKKKKKWAGVGFRLLWKKRVSELFLGRFFFLVVVVGGWVYLENFKKKFGKTFKKKEEKELLVLIM